MRQQVYQNAQLTEYVLACYDRATQEQKREVIGNIVSKNRNPDVIITKMTMDEKMFLLCKLGITATIILTTAEKPDDLATFSKQAQTQIQKQRELKEDYYGERKIFIVTTTQYLKYYHLIAEYQNSRRYLFNRDFADLVRDVKQKKRINELGGQSHNIRTLIRILATSRRSKNYFLNVLNITPVEEDVLMYLAERYERKVFHLELMDELSKIHKTRALKDTIVKLVRREYLRDFSEQESRCYVLSLHGWNAVVAILEKCVI